MKNWKSYAVILVCAFILTSWFPAAAQAEESTKKVVLHYFRIDQNYDQVGVWTWNNGTNGSADGIAKSGADEFGAVIEIRVGADADPTGYFIPLSKDMAADTNQFPPSGDAAKDSYNNADLSYDRTELIEGSIDELHLYFLEGNDHAFVNVDERSMFQKEGFGTLTIVYYDPASDNDPNAYDGWDFWTWDAGTGGTGVFDGDQAIGVPFQWEWKHDGKTMKVGVVNIAPDSQDKVGFIPKKGNWEMKGTFQDKDIMIDVSDIKGSGHKLVMYTRDAPDIVIPGSAPQFIPYDVASNSGTYAKTPTEVAAEFTMRIEPSLANTEHFAVLDEAGEQLQIESIEYVDRKDTKLLLRLASSSALDKTKKYVVQFQEQTMELDVDHYPPVIHYTKKRDYVVEKGAEFSIDDYVRISAIDERAGNLTTQMKVEGEVNTKKPGEYTLTYSAIDDWGNVGSQSFVFTVTGAASPIPPIVYAAVAAVLVIVIAPAIAIVMKRRSKTVKT